jgi:hypothetical protein
MGKFKKGDKVRCVVGFGKCISEGTVYEVLEDTGEWVRVVSDEGILGGYKPYRFELFSSSTYIINGAPYEYPTLAGAEAGVKAIGNNGVTYEIAQIVKRVTVKRETVVTLEETV